MMRLVRRLQIALTILAVAIGASVAAGPLSSGAIFLLRAAPQFEPDNETPQDPPVHKGHTDIGTGLYIREDDDFFIDGVTRPVIRRTYLSGDHASRQFGVGTTHSGEWFLRGDASNLVWVELMLSDWGRIRFNRVTPGKSFATALFQHESTPTEFYGALLGWVGWEWVMRFADGRIAIFKACGPVKHDVCSLIEMRFPGGRTVSYVRDASGRLTAIRSGGQSISLEYDDGGRIVRGRHTSGRTTTYEYDDQGRLRRQASSDGELRSYGYNDRDEMITIAEPGRVIENEFEDGRLVKQITRSADDDPYTLRLSYTVVDGRVTMNDITENDGTHTVYRFNENHYTLSEIIDARGSNPVSITYDRSFSTNIALAMTIRCLGPEGHVIRTVPTSPGLDDEVKRSVIATECR